MKKEFLLIVKIGGSCFSDKKIPRSLHIDVIDSICEQLQGIDMPVVIVHGGGSYGHPVAKKYAIQEGRQDTIPDQALGFCKTHDAMVELNHAIVGRFLAHDLPAYPVQTSAVFVQRDGEAVISNLTPVDALLDQGFMPVLYGDSVIDESRGFGIMSGDSVIVELANGLARRTSNIVYLMDVDGLHDKNPKLDASATLFTDVYLRGEHVLVPQGDSMVNIEDAIEQADEAIDVTGGILNKVRALRNIKRKDIAIALINGRVPSRLAALIAGDDVPRTRITILDDEGAIDG
ncbi:MAG TPA: isopentenyl phosphate kinase [Candidatus Lokiarchaeia archaeon]|nr:isopentenyl phosphate kinase [Candidatus Lokiarchaeia archaeon]